MKKHVLFIIGIFLMNTVYSQTASQELISGSGDSFTNSAYQLDWSLGECVTATHSEGNYIITQGFHQDNYVLSIIEDLAKDINISVYPNPTSDLVSVDLSGTSLAIEQINILTITDVKGKILQTKEVENEIEQLDFVNFANGIYFLSLKQGNKIIKSYKILKK